MIFEIRKDGKFVGAFRIKNSKDFSLYEVVGDLQFSSIEEDDGIIGTNDKVLVFELKPLDEIVTEMHENPSKSEKLMQECFKLEEAFKRGEFYG